MTTTCSRPRRRHGSCGAPRPRRAPPTLRAGKRPEVAEDAGGAEAGRPVASPLQNELFAARGLRPLPRAERNGARWRALAALQPRAHLLPAPVAGGAAGQGAREAGARAGTRTAPGLRN
eukprot:8001763-Lingulodinium_polyedra.AAC.1